MIRYAQWKNKCLTALYYPRFSVQDYYQRHGPGFRRGHDGHQLRLLRQL